MKLTRTYLKQLIKEEMGRGLKEWELPKGGGTTDGGDQQGEQEEDPKLQDLRQKMIDVSKSMTGIQGKELAMVNFFIELIDLAKREKIDVGQMQQRIGLVQQTAEKI